MDVHLVDGTYELFRYFFAMPSHVTAAGQEVGATRGAVGTVLQLLEEGATHVGVATDHVIESFRNDLWPTYKDGSGVDPTLKSQFPLLEEALASAGVVVWPMVELEADDALGAAAAAAASDGRVDRVVICTPDKDLGQCVGGKVFQLDRRKGALYGVDGVREKFGVGPASIPDYLALVGDASDGYPGLPGWGAKSSAAVLARFVHLESIPADWREWHVNAANPGALAHTLSQERDRALLFRTLATLRTDIALFDDVDQLRWNGPTPAFAALGARFDAAVMEPRRRLSRRSDQGSDSPDRLASE